MAKYFLIALFCILGATLSKAAFDKEKGLREFMEATDNCMKEAGATKSDLDDLMKEQPASGMPGKCMRACIMKKYKVMNDSGKVDKAAALKNAEEITDGNPDKMKLAIEMVNACADISVPNDHCEAAEAYGKCMKDEGMARGVKKEDFF